VSIPSGSEVTVTSDFTVSGKAAQFGGGIIDEVGGKLIAEFAKRLAAQLAHDCPAEQTDVDAGGIVANADGDASGIPLLETPPRVADARAPEAIGNNAVNVWALIWWPVAKRVLIPVLIVIALGAAVWIYGPGHHN
jgi:hypothetical protein